MYADRYTATARPPPALAPRVVLQRWLAVTCGGSIVEVGVRGARAPGSSARGRQRFPEGCSSSNQRRVGVIRRPLGYCRANRLERTKTWGALRFYNYLNNYRTAPWLAQAIASECWSARGMHKFREKQSLSTSS